MELVYCHLFHRVNHTACVAILWPIVIAICQSVATHATVWNKWQ